jgi:hypothetical protein
VNSPRTPTTCSDQQGRGFVASTNLAEGRGDPGSLNRPKFEKAQTGPTTHTLQHPASISARIDPSGAETANSSLRGLRVYEADQTDSATEIRTTVAENTLETSGRCRVVGRSIIFGFATNCILLSVRFDSRQKQSTSLASGVRKKWPILLYTSS